MNMYHFFVFGIIVRVCIIFVQSMRFSLLLCYAQAKIPLYMCMCICFDFFCSIAFPLLLWLTLLLFDSIIDSGTVSRLLLLWLIRLVLYFH